MAANSQFDLNQWGRSAADQFKGLNPNEPGQWPLLPKLATFVFVALLAIGLGYFLLLADVQAQLEGEVAKEPALKEDYKFKVAQAANRPELEKQKEQVVEYVNQLEKQLPRKAEMDALLSDINQAGIGRGLVFEFFRPGNEIVKDFYAEQPIAIRVAGRYHDFGSFASDVSNLSRIVTLHGLNVGQPQQTKDASGLLFMEATARTYRYLDPAEVAEQQRLKAKAAQEKK